MDRNQIIEIVFICDNGYVLPTVTAITSIIANKRAETYLRIHLVAVELTHANLSIFRRFVRDLVEIAVHEATMDKVEMLCTAETGSFCAATPAALFKFHLPEILADCSRVLYLDGDIILRGDLAELYGSDLEGHPLGAVVDSGSIYFKHAYVSRVRDYFNSGVMLMDLDRMRRMNASEALVNEKIASRDSTLMDQNVFNTVFDGQFRLLPIKYNCPYVSLYRARGKYTINQLNERYGTVYRTLDEARDAALILHYSSKDKPWKNGSVPGGDEWLKYCRITMDAYGLELPLSAGYTEKTQEPAAGEPMVSIITPVYNLEQYIAQCIESVLAQTLPGFEMICVDDGSADGSLRLLMDYANKDPRVRVATQTNQGQSAARNHGFEMARGHYIYYLDGDDMLRPDALANLAKIAGDTAADVVLFNGDAFYETEKLREQFPAYDTFYHRKQAYHGVTEGAVLFSQMVACHDHKSTPGLYFIRRSFHTETGLRFREGILHEDNLFAIQLMIRAARAVHMPSAFFLRRVRPDSIMTSQKTYANYLGFLTVAIGIVRFLEQNTLPQHALEAAHRQLKIIVRNATEIYRQLDRNARLRPAFPDCREEIIASMLIPMIENACAATEATNEKTALAEKYSAETEKAAQDKTALEQELKAVVEKAAQEKITQERELKAAVEKAAQEKITLEQELKAATEKAAQEKLVLGQKYTAAADKATKEKMSLEQKHAAEAEKAARKKKALEDELAAIRSSYSYNIGRAITRVPRKFRNGIRNLSMRSFIQSKDKTGKT